MTGYLLYLIRKLLRLLTFFVISVGVTAIIALYYIAYVLPDTNELKDMRLQVPLQVFTQDGKLIAEYGEKRRIPVPFDQIPKPLIDAVLATEDQRYFQHPGIDLPGLARATVQLIITGRKDQGGSTITMQVARSFYLSPHKTFSRKLREVLLALKIDHALSKEKILELYLNKIFLGNRAYGVAAAAQIYYGKTLNQLSLDQFAMLAGLPKAPSTLNPLANPDAAKKRRDHVLLRMLELHYIDQEAYDKAIDEPLNASYHDLHIQMKAPYAAELTRQQLEQMYGKDIYTSGYMIYTTIDSNTQMYANDAVRENLLAYDRRHGYRGPERNLGKPHPEHMLEWQTTLHNMTTVNGLEPAAVTKVSDQSVKALRANGSIIIIPWEGLSWARKQINADHLGPMPTTAHEIIRPGDVIRITFYKNHTWYLSQIPKAEAGLVALNPENGAVTAMVGGFDYQTSKFNRIVNAQRQPGSSFKPFFYAAALDKGLTLSTLINDAPIVIPNPTDNTVWRPQNDTRKFYGPTRLREAIIHSRNLVSIRILNLIEIPYAINYMERFGFTANQLPPTLSLALGTPLVTPLQMAGAYAVFANGGYRVPPYIIDSIHDPQGKLVFQANPQIACETCFNAPINPTQTATETATYATRVISPKIVFLMNSALRDVILHGTGAAAKSLNRSDLAGKTGTTQDNVDAWFDGYSANTLVAITWIGFDTPRSLHEWGAQAALPMWIDFMRNALAGKPEHHLLQPPGVVSIRINPETGKRASIRDTQDSVFEYFLSNHLPEQSNPATLGDSNNSNLPDGTALY